MAITSRLRQLSGVRKMLKIEELILSLNSNYKIERHRNSYGQGFGSYMHGYPNSYSGSALLYDELNCYDLIYKENTVLGEIHFVPLKHVEGIHYISLNGYLKSTAKAQFALREERDHIENRMSALREERDNLGEHLQSKIEKEFLIKSI